MKYIQGQNRTQTCLFPVSPDDAIDPENENTYTCPQGHTLTTNATYKKRQAIVEHPYGTIKRQWGFSYIMTKKTIQRASADVGFMMIAYNLRRLINIIGIRQFKEYLKEMLNLLLVLSDKLGLKRGLLKSYYFRKLIFITIFEPSLKRLYLTHKIY